MKPVNQWRTGPGSPLKAQAFVQSESNKPQLSKMNEQKSADLPPMANIRLLCKVFACLVLEGEWNINLMTTSRRNNTAYVVGNALKNTS